MTDGDHGEGEGAGSRTRATARDPVVLCALLSALRHHDPGASIFRRSGARGVVILDEVFVLEPLTLEQVSELDEQSSITLVTTRSSWVASSMIPARWGIVLVRDYDGPVFLPRRDSRCSTDELTLERDLRRAELRPSAPLCFMT